MKLACIVTLANAPFRLRFLAMERSLRATGCDLPLLVIPYDDRRFDLPPNATWWEMPSITGWLERHGAHRMMRKYQCLTLANYQYVDADVCFVRNPAEVLAPLDGFVTSCGQWHNPAETYTKESVRRFRRASTTWQKDVFNAGQFACDRALYTEETLFKQAETPGFIDTCLTFPYHDQPGMNLLVHETRVAVRNLTLSPWNMQSTWAGDYNGDYRPYWTTSETTPYLIHWAGIAMLSPRPINQLFLERLEPAERAEWDAFIEARRRAYGRFNWRWWLRNRVFKMFRF